MTPDIDQVAAIIRETAQIEILPRFNNLRADEIREKQPGDLVTEADIRAEARLSRLLREILPGSLVVGEEAVAANERVLDALAGEDTVWVVDPVDGTRNFAHGRPAFGVIVALVVNGHTVAGWIHDPVNDITASAEIGQGAWIGGRRLSVSKESAIAEMTGAIGCRMDVSCGPAVAAVTERLVRQGSCAHDYLALAEGRIQFACYRRLTPWDHAAGILVHSEAGGYNRRLDRSRYYPRLTMAGVLLTPGPESWEKLFPLVREK